MKKICFTYFFCMIYLLFRLKEEIREAKGLHEKPSTKQTLSIRSFALGCKYTMRKLMKLILEGSILYNIA